MMPVRWKIESAFGRARRRLRFLRFWLLLALLGIAECAGFATLAGLVDRGVVRTPLAFAVSVVGLLGAGLVGLLVIAIAAAAARPAPARLAAALEKLHPPLLDRLNTLVFLEPRRGDPEVAPFYERIERQADQALPHHPLPPAFSAARVRLAILLCALAVVSTFALYDRLEPWERLSWDPEVEAGTDEAEGAAKLEPPPESAAEVDRRWGEVRITEPGHDVKATKVDVVPLQVEVASSQRLESAQWLTAVNGGASTTHALARPSESNYALYKPLVALDELRLQDWDLLSYYASASTVPGTRYASDIYFIEVRPFREDIARLPGGEGGQAYAGLNQLTGLIERQRHIVRETHRYQQRPPENPKMRRQDRDKLAEAQGELAVAARHLYAKLAAEMENQPIGNVLTALDRAAGFMEQARDLLAQDAPEALAREQSALQELVATRKAFQKFISDDPGAFGSGGGDDSEDENVPVAGLEERLKEILELRDAEKAAREEVRRSLERQRALAEKVDGAEPEEQEALAGEQDEIRRPLEALGEAQPRAFRGAEKEVEGALSAMKQASAGLREGAEDATDRPRVALAALESLQSALGRRHAARELDDAYRLKQVLDEGASRMKAMAAAPDRFSSEDARGAAAGSREAARGLKEIVDRPPGGDAFGPDLRRALSDAELRRLESKLGALGHAEGPEARGVAAEKARRGVEEITAAFQRSQPDEVKALRADRLKTPEDEALQLALDRIDSLLARAEAPRPAAPEDEARQRRELLLDLRAALESLGDGDERTAALLVQAEGLLGEPMSAAERLALKKLREQIEHFHAEMRAPAGREDEAALSRVDPARLPAAYRDRIERYFERLSEME